MVKREYLFLMFEAYNTRIVAENCEHEQRITDFFIGNGLVDVIYCIIDGECLGAYAINAMTGFVKFYYWWGGRTNEKQG